VNAMLEEGGEEVVVVMRVVMEMRCSSLVALEGRQEMI